MTKCYSEYGISSTTARIVTGIPKEYHITATCEVCGGTKTVTFTCCGKLPNDNFSQSKVDAWSYKCYDGYSGDCISNRTTIGWKGCALTALATLINYYGKTYPGMPQTDPGLLNDFLKSLPIPQGYDRKGDVNFGAISEYTKGKVVYDDKESCNFKKGCETVQDIIDKINLEILSKRPVILRLSNDKGNTHFVLAVGKCEDKYVISARRINKNVSELILVG